jgi:hypothetical protein
MAIHDSVERFAGNLPECTSLGGDLELVVSTSDSRALQHPTTRPKPTSSVRIETTAAPRGLQSGGPARGQPLNLRAAWDYRYRPSPTDASHALKRGPCTRGSQALESASGRSEARLLPGSAGPQFRNVDSMCSPASHSQCIPKTWPRRFPLVVRAVGSKAIKRFTCRPRIET